MQPSFALFLNHGLRLIPFREEKHGRYRPMTHMARESGLGVLSVGNFVKLGKNDSLLFLASEESIGKNSHGPVLWTLLICLAYHPTSHAFIGMHVCVGCRHLLPSCVTLLWLLAPRVVSWLVLTLGRKEMGSFIVEGTQCFSHLLRGTVLSGQE